MHRIAKTYNYPVMVNGRYIMSPSPIPKFDNPKLDRSPALQLYGAGREKRIYAVPPHTPPVQTSFTVQYKPSLHVPPSFAGCGSHVSRASLQTPTLHWEHFTPR